MSSATTRRPLAEAQAVADEILAQLAPHCEKISLAGSIRRQRPTIGDIEIVCIPQPYESAPLLRSGIALVVEQWEKIRGELPCRYTQRLLPCGMKLDLFMPDPRGYGLQLAIRTGSADWCRQVLAPAWVRADYYSEDGVLHLRVDEDFPDNWDTTVDTPDERELFRRIGLTWVEPVDREVQP
jgi:DNA polymerase/3'-5' exonuclease PolX